MPQTISPHIARRIRNLQCSWQYSLVDRSNKHSHSYGFRRIGRNVKPDALQNRIGQTVFFAWQSFWIQAIKFVHELPSYGPPSCNMRVRQVRKGHPLPVNRMAQFLEQWIITQAVSNSCNPLFFSAWRVSNKVGDAPLTHDT